MSDKGFTEQMTSIETPNGGSYSEKPLKPQKVKPNRVDINVLKSKLQESESKEFKKNLFLM